MSIKSDKWIKRMALDHKMIEPFVDEQMRTGVISYGLSSYGYDIRVADDFKVFTNIYNTVVDPKSFDPKSFVDIKADVCIIPPNSFALARTIENSNTTPLPAKIYSNEGIAQVLFFQSDEVCRTSYKDKKGKYQAQRGVTLPKI